MVTVSPMRRSIVAMWAPLCSVALETTTPPTMTGSMTARGVRTPVRPTWIAMSRSLVTARSGSNLCAIAHRGTRDEAPRASRWAKGVHLMHHPVHVQAKIGPEASSSGVGGHQLRKRVGQIAKGSRTGKPPVGQLP